MPDPIKLQFGAVNLSAGAPDSGAEMPPETPFRLLISGDFTGDAARPPLENRKPIPIDRDNFDEVLAKLAPRVVLAGAANGADVTIAFASLDDFDPDRLFASLPVFDDLRALREALDQPSTFAQAAAKVRAWAKLPEPAAEGPKPPQSGGELLAQMLGEEASQAAAPPDEWQRFLKRIVQPQLVEKTDPRKGDYEAIIEEAIAAQMRAILHHPRFQALESAWRSVHLLVKELPTDETLQIYILDGRAREWQADLTQADPRGSVFVRVMTEHAAERPWAALVSLETFGNSIDDLQALGSMLLVAAHVRAPLLAAASPRLIGCPSLASDPDPRTWSPDPNLAAAWKMIRGLAQARYLGLVLPRFLVRLPYGKDAATTESFPFEEMPKSEHEHYLWGSGAVLCARMLAEGFVAAGWDMDPKDVREVHGLPLHVYDEDGSSTVKPCAEVHLRETALEALLDHGLMALLSIRERDGVRLSRFQAAAQGQEPLAGRW